MSCPGSGDEDVVVAVVSVGSADSDGSAGSLVAGAEVGEVVSVSELSGSFVTVSALGVIRLSPESGSTLAKKVRYARCHPS